MGVIDTKDWILVSIKMEYSEKSEREIKEITRFLETQSEEEYEDLILDWSRRKKEAHIRGLTLSKYILDRFDQYKKTSV